MTEKMRAFPKGISREERGKLFCIEAKRCSGKAKSKEEAKAICDAQPPKEAKVRKKRGGECPACPPCGDRAAKPVAPEKLPCPQATQRAINTMEAIMDKVKSGAAGQTGDLKDQLILDIVQCHPKETEVPTLTLAALDTLKTLGKESGGYYYKGEISELKRQFDLVRKLLE
jgi:hypothetical protein